MNADFRRQDEHASVSAAQQGSLPAGRLIVEGYQRDLLGAAYLLTGDRSAAQQLAGRAFERAFDQLRGFDPDDELFPWLAERLAAVYLAPPDEGPSTSPAARLPVVSSEPERYNVDDERSRARNALALIDPSARLMLVLSDYAGLTEEQIAAAFGGRQELDETFETIDRARARLRQSAGLDDGPAVAVALRRVAIDAPRVSLWAEIEPKIAALYSRQRSRSLAYTWGAAGVAGLIIAGLLVLLLYGALSSGDEGTGTGAFGAISPATPTPEFVTATLPPLEPPATATYVPSGEVPDRVLVQLSGRPGIPPPLGVYDPTTGELIELPAGELVGISPDGGTLLFLERQPALGRLNMTVIAVSTDTFQERWRADAGPLQASGPNSIFFDLTVVDDLVYVATHDPDYLSENLSIAIIRLSDGGTRTFWGLDMNVTMGAQGIEVDLLGTSSPGEPTITVLVRSTKAGWTKVQQINVRSGEETIDSGSIAGMAQPLSSRQLLPGVRGIYKIPHNGPSRRPSVPFLNFDTMTDGNIRLPFERPGTSTTIIVEYVLSHDGRRLYAVSPYSGQVAIIDLERRQVERMIDLDGAAIPASTPEGLTTEFLATYYQHNAATFSPDGRYLYALGPLRELPSGYTPGIWKIDTSAWDVVADWTPGGSSSTLMVSAGSGNRLYSFTFFTRISSGSVAPGQLASPEVPQTLILDTTSGQILSTRDIIMLGTLADLYRDAYGRSPGVEVGNR